MSTIPLGEDILLARHGANIIKFRQDRKNGRTVAYLRNGQTDTAANLVARVGALTPADSMRGAAERFLNDEATVSRREARTLAKISLGYSIVAGVVFGGLLLALYHVGGADSLQYLTSYSF
ncbi:hypothetical protein GCM10027417_14280 [Glutamicibacter endophyticus]|uniref:hypothetical protein n=1 Tax=Glutamicibacter sp. PS TaxID=3075634 RepID=UPI00284B8EF8|nr:hypothetical protein [Glutamicibacter sp. PS]MDR4534173.1 hypothetical protein [Glutamicibacter sp. PS]